MSSQNVNEKEKKDSLLLKTTVYHYRFYQSKYKPAVF